MNEPVANRFRELEGLANRIHGQLQAQIERLGFDAGEVTLKTPSQAAYRLEKDPANGEFSLVGDWLDERGAKQGSLLFHADGSFFVEQDIVRPHPRKKQWFVEAVNAWGQGETIKAEPRLLPMPE